MLNVLYLLVNLFICMLIIAMCFQNGSFSAHYID